MKKAFFVLTVLIFLASNAFAQSQTEYAAYGSVPEGYSIENRWALGARYGMVSEDDSSGLGENIEHATYGNLSYGFNDNFLAELEFGSLAEDVFDADYYSLMANLQLRYPIEALAVYGIAGFGFQNDKDDLVFDDADESWTTKLGGGAEFFFNPNWAVNGEVVYVFAGDQSFDAWEYRTGIKYYFEGL